MFIAEAAAVGVAVHDADAVGANALARGQPRVHIGRDRLGAQHLREDRVALGVHLDQFGLAAAQDFGEPAGAVAPHVVHHHAQPSRLDWRHVDQAGNLRHVGGLGVEVLDPAGSQPVGQADALDGRLVICGGDRRLDLL